MVDFSSSSLPGLRDALKAGKTISRWVFEGVSRELSVQISRLSKKHCPHLYRRIAFSLLKTQVEEKAGKR